MPATPFGTAAGSRWQRCAVASPTAGHPRVRVVAGWGAFAVDARREELDDADRAVRVGHHSFPLDADGPVWRFAPGFPVRLEEQGQAVPLRLGVFALAPPE